MDFIKIMILRALDWLTACGFVGGCEQPETFGEFSCADPFTIPSDLKKVLVIFEGAATGDLMELLSGPPCLAVRCSWSIARSNRRESSIGMMGVLDNICMGHGREEGESLTLQWR